MSLEHSMPSNVFATLRAKKIALLCSASWTIPLLISYVADTWTDQRCVTPQCISTSMVKQCLPICVYVSALIMADAQVLSLIQLVMQWLKTSRIHVHAMVVSK